MCRLHTAFPLAWVWPQAQYTSLRHTQSTSVQRGRQQGHPHTNTHICTQAACCLPWTTHKQAGLQGRQHLTANERLASWEPAGKQRQTACVYIYIPFHFFFLQWTDHSCFFALQAWEQMDLQQGTFASLLHRGAEKMLQVWKHGM